MGLALGFFLGFSTPPPPESIHGSSPSIFTEVKAPLHAPYLRVRPLCGGERAGARLATPEVWESQEKPHRWWRKCDTVDGRNPAKPPVLYEILPDMGCSQYQLVQDFFHQQWNWWIFPNTHLIILMIHDVDFLWKIEVLCTVHCVNLDSNVIPLLKKVIIKLMILPFLNSLLSEIPHCVTSFSGWILLIRCGGVSGNPWLKSMVPSAILAHPVSGNGNPSQGFVMIPHWDKHMGTGCINPNEWECECAQFICILWYQEWSKTSFIH